MKQAMLAAAVALSAILGQGTAAQAEERVTLGFARLFTNDALGDTHDRWRSGSYYVSRFRAPRWGGSLPTQFGELLEFRLRTEIIAPESLTDPTPDRRYVGVIAPGMATHFDMGGVETLLGAELVFTGPQTGVGRFQREVHDLLGLDEPTVLDSQITDGVHPTVYGEMARSFAVSDRVTLRPFAEAQAGVESYLRFGGDMVVGNFGRGGLMSRDTVTGQRVEGIAGTINAGTSFTLGGDVAQVFDSVYLPESGTAELTDTRMRLRAGFNWQGERSALFYGVTWLGKEYEDQPDGQVVGSLRLNLRF
ncbi:hypothetical protein SAMN04488103_11286 [Gemmobacter aquatilis]|uniref:Lipid A deacylase LpxR family protein n=1 Tax=Gemmobacter aquatilis TaxID=933059 RepID=A0A1H8M6A9_9RHOB|nr:lipid A-modifier LpxR family protein [Gemmobacter aquatilis]SEO12738.1 hypothetical protein SAMN04488103_11286 [Gemmobacter aquatilis]